MTAPFTTPEQPRRDATIRRDQWGRYRIPHPETGEEQSWSRATTLAGTLADRFGLEKWAKRNVALGLAARHDLYAKVATCKPDETSKLNALVVEAEEAAAASAGANLGTALHRFTERIDAGETVDVPPPWNRDIDAYRQAMRTHDVSVHPNWIERVLVVPELDVAGTCDRVCTSGNWIFPRIADLKTGKDVVRYGMTEIALQLAIYAHATHTYDPVTNTCHKITANLDQDRALVMHLPVGRGECTIYEVDIAAGWEAVQLAVDVRNWRKRDNLATQLVPRQLTLQAVPDPIDPDALTWLHDRVQAIKAAGHAQRLATYWSLAPEIPTFPKGGPTTIDQFNTIDDWCDKVEMETGMPFGPSNPTTPTPTKSTRKTTA